MLTKVTSRSTSSARACDCVAKSVTAVRLYAAFLRSLLVVTAIVPDVLLRISRTIENSGGRGKDAKAASGEDRFPTAAVPSRCRLHPCRQSLSAARNLALPAQRTACGGPRPYPAAACR